MSEPTSVPVKVCGVRSVAEAWMAVECNVTTIGVMITGPGALSLRTATKIIGAVKRRAATCLVTAEDDLTRLSGLVRVCCPDLVQLTRPVRADVYRALRARGLAVIQTVFVTDCTSALTAAGESHLADLILLDSPRGPGLCGGCHDWGISRQIRDEVPVPILLAGGLTAENVGRAIAEVRPAGLDVCSGVRENGLLDEKKLRRFVAAARSASVALMMPLEKGDADNSAL